MPKLSAVSNMSKENHENLKNLGIELAPQPIFKSQENLISLQNIRVFNP